MDKFTSIRAFTKVVETGGFAAAAREMRLSRSAVSKYVNDLERELGVQLLHRTTRSASPTENGLLYYERCRSILAELEDADLAITRFQVEPKGVLRVNAPVSFGALYLGPAIGDFIKRYPELQLQVVLSDQMVDSVQEGFDVTLRIAELASSSLIARKIAPTRHVFCAAPSYLERAGIPRHPNDLRHHDCLTTGYLSTGNHWKVVGPDGEHWVQVDGPLCANNCDVLRAAAMKGLGITFLPTFIVGADLQQGTLRIVLADYRMADMALYAVYSPTRHLSTKVRVFIDFLVERFGSHPYWDDAAYSVHGSVI